MCSRRALVGRLLAVFTAVMASSAAPTSADPVSVGVFLEGVTVFARTPEELVVSFPDFTVDLVDVTQLMPGFCFSCGTGASVPFTQTTGPFSGHSMGNALGTIDADVSGSLTFTGPTETLVIDPSNPFGGTVLSVPVQLSGTLTITQPNLVLFNGTVSGSGTGSVDYDTFPAGGTRLAGFQYSVHGVAATPEPASLIFLGTGVACLIARRRTAAFRRRGKELRTT